MQAVGPRLMGWSTVEDVSGAHASQPETTEFLNQLLAANLVTDHSDMGREARLPAVSSASYTLYTRDVCNKWRLPLGAIWSFARGCRRAHRELTSEPLREVVARARAQAKTTDFDLKLLQLALLQFRTMRYLFPRSYLCLFDALALLHFLSSYNIRPTWVFGVSSEPFQAHCWLQLGEVVLNDTLERTRAFTPIMAA